MDIIKYTPEGLDNINQTDLLTKDDFKLVENMSDELQDTFLKQQVFRTETEMRVSVLNDISFPTSASKYWQCVREQGVFFDNLINTSFDYRKNEVKLKKNLKRIKEVTDDLEIEELKIEIDKCLYTRKHLQNQARDRVRELKLWSKIKNELNDGSFDIANVDTHQLVSYTQRYLLECVAVYDTKAELSHPEAVNLIGQTISMLKLCEEKGVFDKTISIISIEKQKNILPKLGYDLQG